MYLFDNELFAIECMAKYAMGGLNVTKGGIHNGLSDEFAHCPVPSCQGDWGYYLTFYDHQHQGLLQSKDRDRKCFVTYKTKLWLDTYPPNYFELYDIYDKFNSGEYNSQFGCVGALSPCSKAIIAIEPDGTQRHFVSGTEAARELKINRAQLSRLLNSDKQQPRCGKFKNYQFFYAAKVIKKPAIKPA